MNSEESKEGAGAQQEKTPAGVDAGSEQQAVDIVERAKQERILLEAENKKLAENITRLEKLRSEQILGGGSLAGQIEKSPKQKLDDEDQAFADRLMNKYYPERKVRL